MSTFTLAEGFFFIFSCKEDGAKIGYYFRQLYSQRSNDNVASEQHLS